MPTVSLAPTTTNTLVNFGTSWNDSFELLQCGGGYTTVNFFGSSTQFSDVEGVSGFDNFIFLPNTVITDIEIFLTGVVYSAPFNNINTLSARLYDGLTIISSLQNTFWDDSAGIITQSMSFNGLSLDGAFVNSLDFFVGLQWIQNSAGGLTNSDCYLNCFEMTVTYEERSLDDSTFRGRGGQRNRLAWGVR